MNRAWLAVSLLAVAARPGIQEPKLYNQGVTAYHSNDFTAASQAFEQALPSPDRRLQERAMYNLGNTLYRLGEARPQEAEKTWQRAIKNYESALALDPKDEDAKFNREFVKKKLEELQKQQQQQQNQHDKDKDQKKDDQQQQQKQDQLKQDQQQQQKPDDKQDQQKQEQEKEKQREKERQQQQGQDQKDQQQKQDQQPQPQQGQSDKLEKQQAKALLDNLREDERNWNFFPEVQMKDLKTKGPPAKDW